MLVWQFILYLGDGLRKIGFIHKYVILDIFCLGPKNNVQRSCVLNVYCILMSQYAKNLVVSFVM